MPRRDQAGFTLIELILVMAISSMLIVIAFIGQRGVRSRAQFDAAINKLVATVADARNEATTGVNLLGTGDGTVKCPGGPNPGTKADGRYTFAGTAWSANNATTGKIIKLDYYEAFYGDPDDPTKSPTACVFQTRDIAVPSDLQVNVNSPAAQQGGRILFVRTSTSALVVCWVSDLTVDVVPTYQTGGCTPPSTAKINLTPPPPWPTLTFSNADGHSAVITIDPSGLVRRTN